MHFWKANQRRQTWVMWKSINQRKILSPQQESNHDLPNTGRVLYPLSYGNSWRARSFNRVHVWQQLASKTDLQSNRCNSETHSENFFYVFFENTQRNKQKSLANWLNILEKQILLACAIVMSTAFKGGTPVTKLEKLMVPSFVVRIPFRFRSNSFSQYRYILRLLSKKS